MKYQADIHIKEEPKKLYECLLSEISDDERTKVSLHLDSSGLHIHIMSLDATALRAACNSVTRLICVFFDAKKGLKNE